MKLITYHHFTQAPKHEYLETYTSISHILEKTHGKSMLSSSKLYNILDCCTEKDMQENYKHLSHLDLACGYIADMNNEEEPNNIYRHKEPWLARATHHLGMTTFGLDKLNSPNENYTHIQANLLDKPSSFHRFKDNTFDIVTAFDFFNKLEFMSDEKDAIIFQDILPEINRITKPNGYFIFTTKN